MTLQNGYKEPLKLSIDYSIEVATMGIEFTVSMVNFIMIFESNLSVRMDSHLINNVGQ